MSTPIAGAMNVATQTIEELNTIIAGLRMLLRAREDEIAELRRERDSWHEAADRWCREVSRLHGDIAATYYEWVR